MGKPFKLEGQPARGAGIGRGADGRFFTIKEEAPHELLVEAERAGETVADAARKVAAPVWPVGSETPKGGKDAVYDPSIPWPEAGPINDTNQVPFKLK